MSTKISFNIYVETNDIHSKIKEKRLELGWSTARLARTAGVSEKTIGNLENPKFVNSFSEQVILKIEKALDIELFPKGRSLCRNLVPLKDKFTNIKYLEIEND